MRGSPVRVRPEAFDIFRESHGDRLFPRLFAVNRKELLYDWDLYGKPHADCVGATRNISPRAAPLPSAAPAALTGIRNPAPLTRRFLLIPVVVVKAQPDMPASSHPSSLYDWIYTIKKCNYSALPYSRCCAPLIVGGQRRYAPCPPRKSMKIGSHKQACDTSSHRFSGVLNSYKKFSFF